MSQQMKPPKPSWPYQPANSDEEREEIFCERMYDWMDEYHQYLLGEISNRRFFWFNPLSGLWSDRFFNSKEVSSLLQEVSNIQDPAEVVDTAKEFLETNWDCPFDAEWLCADLIRRL